MNEHADIVAPMRPPVLDLLARAHTSVGRYDRAEPLIRAAIGESERLGDALGLAVQTQTLGVLLPPDHPIRVGCEALAASFVRS